MSATRDKTQKIAFVYSNLYQIYRKGVDAAKAAPETDLNAPHFTVPHNKGQILKSENVHQAELQVRSEPAFQNHVEEYRPTEFLAKRLAPRPDAIRTQLAAAPVPRPAAALDSLKGNLKALNDLHSRLRFMLQELEDLVKE